MPEALSIDKELVKGLVLQGFSNKEVCIQTGVADNVLRAWKCRYGWNKALRAMHSAMEVVQVKKAQSAVSEKYEQIKESIATELVADLQVIKDRPAKSLVAARNRQTVLSMIAGTAKTVYGEQGGSTIFNFPLMDSAKLDTTPPIDIKSELVEPKQLIKIVVAITHRLCDSGDEMQNKLNHFPHREKFIVSFSGCSASHLPVWDLLNEMQHGYQII